MIVTKTEIYDVPQHIVESAIRLEATKIDSRIMAEKYEDWDVLGKDNSEHQEELSYLINTKIGEAEEIAIDLIKNSDLRDFLIDTNIK